LEDNPLKAKARKANQDNLSAEMRQMEEQFTSYDFKKMQRRSYYPHNQHLISTATATSSGLASSRPGTPANDLRVENSGLRIEGNDVRMESGIYSGNNLEINGGDETMSMKERDTTRVDKFQSEKEFAQA